MVFNPDAVAFATKYPDKDISTVVVQSEATNFQYLATMCSSNGLSVAPPSDLASASAPVLTLDRDGFLAVYVGREGFGSAGRDILMFRPLSGDEVVDVYVITQLPVPILARRNADGIVVFEAHGSHHRQVKVPDEAVVVCVDLSQSMNERCGFIDIEENEDATASISSRQPVVTTSTSPPVEHPGGELLALEELKGYRSRFRWVYVMQTFLHSFSETTSRSRIYWLLYVMAMEITSVSKWRATYYRSLISSVSSSSRRKLRVLQLLDRGRRLSTIVNRLRHLSLS